MSKTPKPVIHKRDHEHGGADPIRIAWESVGTSGGGATTIDTFAITGGPFTVDNNPLDLNTPDIGAMHFYGSPSFATSSGLAWIAQPGMYVIGLQVNVQTQITLTSDVYVTSQLSYQGDVGYGIEVPWFGFPPGSTEQILGTHYKFPSGMTSSFDIGLQRLHPISLTSATTFPLAIQPRLYSTHTAGELKVNWMGLWGFRLGGPLDAYHSD